MPDLCAVLLSYNFASGQAQLSLHTFIHMNSKYFMESRKQTRWACWPGDSWFYLQGASAYRVPRSVFPCCLQVHLVLQRRSPGLAAGILRAADNGEVWEGGPHRFEVCQLSCCSPIPWVNALRSLLPLSLLHYFPPILVVDRGTFESF